MFAEAGTAGFFAAVVDARFAVVAGFFAAVVFLAADAGFFAAAVFFAVVAVLFTAAVFADVVVFFTAVAGFLSVVFFEAVAGFLTVVVFFTAEVVFLAAVAVVFFAVAAVFFAVVFVFLAAGMIINLLYHDLFSDCNANVCSVQPLRLCFLYPCLSVVIPTCQDYNTVNIQSVRLRHSKPEGQSEKEGHAWIFPRSSLIWSAG